MDTAYRTDLRDFNEINFARFDAKLTERLTQFEARVERRLAELETKFEARLVELDRKIETRTLSLRTEIAQAKTEMVRWMFAFWVATVGMMFLVRLT